MIIKKDFVENIEIKNVELGAGCNEFGKKYYPQCYLTTIDADSIKQCKPKPKIDIYCDAYNTPFQDCRFEHVIICNPFGYGFKTKHDSSKLINEIVRILLNKGKIIIISNIRNSFFKANKIEQYFEEYKKTNNINFVFKMEEIDAEKIYPDIMFFQSDGETQTKPSHQVELVIEKECS